MNAGFFKRASSSLIDIMIVIVVVYATFIIFGRGILQKQVPNFNEIYTAYSEIVDAYNIDLGLLQEEYNALVEIAGDNETLKAEALAMYQDKATILNDQNTIDIEPYNRPITGYFLSTIYYYLFGFLVIMSVYTVLLKGKTLGRTLFQIKTEGSVNVFSIFLHDILLKYFFILMVFAYNLYAGLLLFALSLIIDLVLISVTKKKATLRDLITNIRIVKAGYGY